MAKDFLAFPEQYKVNVDSLKNQSNDPTETGVDLLEMEYDKLKLLNSARKPTKTMTEKTITDKELFEVQLARESTDMKGPYAIIHKEYFYALLAMECLDNDQFVPCIGFRIIVPEQDYPVTMSGQKQWMVLFQKFYDIVDKHITDNTYKNRMLEFLSGKKSGKELMTFYFNSKLNDNSVILQGDIICDAVTKQPIQM